MEFNSVVQMRANAWRMDVSNKMQRKVTASASDGVSFNGQLQNAGAADDTTGVENYRKYLEKRYGNVTIQSIGKDRESLEKAGKSMRGNDVVIAPNILEQMAKEPRKAAYYERKIDAFFADIPRQTAICAAKGLDYQPCGVVIHEDGSVTYISGCADSPKRVAEVNAINRAKREKQAALRKASLERALEAKENESETTSDIVVKPDGSRVLVVTMNIGGMETTMSLEISKPTTLPNDCETENEEDEINHEQNRQSLSENLVEGMEREV